MSEPLNLIQKALQFAREARTEFETSNLGISEPLYPKARREHLYLRMREYISVGCRRAVKLLDELLASFDSAHFEGTDYSTVHMKRGFRRSIAYSVLMQACIDIFHYKEVPELLAVYNNLLDYMIGTH